jgi:hypothetical protein
MNYESALPFYSDRQGAFLFARKAKLYIIKLDKGRERNQNPDVGLIYEPKYPV